MVFIVESPEHLCFDTDPRGSHYNFTLVAHLLEADQSPSHGGASLYCFGYFVKYIARELPTSFDS